MHEIPSRVRMRSRNQGRLAHPLSRASRRILLALCLLASISIGSLASARSSSALDDESPAARRDDAPATEPRVPDDPAARAILERAIAAQNGEKLENAIVDIRGTFEVTTREDGHKLEADVVQAYLSKDRNEYYLSSVRDRTQRKTVTKGFDGRDYWLRDGDRGRLLRARDDRADRTSIDREIDDLKRNLRFLFLANLKGDGITFAMAPKHPEAPESTDGILRVAPDERDVVLFFANETSHLVRVVMPEAGEEPKVRIDFFPPRRKAEPKRCRKVYVEGELAEDLWVPRRVVIYEGDVEDPLHDFFFNEILINSSLEPATFALDPKKADSKE